MQVLTDDDVARLADMRELVEVCRASLVAATGTATSPPRVRVAIGPDDGDDLVFTVGGDAESWGIRAYDTLGRPDGEQLVAAWNRASGRVEAVVVGVGRQARTNLLGAAAVRHLIDVRVVSRPESSRQAFAEQLRGDELGRPVMAVDRVEEAVEDVDIVLLATDAGSPVVPADVLMPGRHVSTVGPKQRYRHELPVAVADDADLVASDSPAQVRAAPDHLLADHDCWDRIHHLGDLVRDEWHRPDDARTLYLSTGLAGSEVAVARHLGHQASMIRSAVTPSRSRSARSEVATGRAGCWRARRATWPSTTS